jgi:hypothetical protein
MLLNLRYFLAIQQRQQISEPGVKFPPCPDSCLMLASAATA